MKFCSGGMLAAIRVKISDSEKKIKLNKNTSDISSIKRVTRSFWKFHVAVVQNNGKEMRTKKVCCTCKVSFLLIRPIFFHPSRCLHRLALHSQCSRRREGIGRKGKWERDWGERVGDACYKKPPLFISAGAGVRKFLIG